MKPANFKWDKKLCHEKSLLFKYKIDFKKEYPSAYSSARKNGWLYEICSHMIPKGNKKKKLIYSYIFPDGFIYIGLTGEPEKRKWTHFNRNDSSVYKHIKKTNLKPFYKELTNFLDVEKSILMEEKIYDYLKNKGYKLLNKSKTGSIGGSEKIWTKEKCKEVFSKYNSIYEIKKNYISAYNAACKNKWLGELTSHINYIPNGFWNDINNCKKESIKYKSRTEFKENSPGCYYASIRNKWIDDITKHMKVIRKKRNYWTKENCLKTYNKLNRNKKELRVKYSRCYYLMSKNKWFN